MICATFFAILFAAASLDANMSPKDKKNTGIYKLSDQEKASLKEWVDNSYTRPSTRKTPSPSLSENLYSGSYLKLTDGSNWNVRPEDTPISQGWISEVEIIIAPSDDPDYPFTLTNSVSRSSILAKKVDTIPSLKTPTTTPTKK